MDTKPSSTDSTVVDLTPVSDACRELVGWYDQQLAADQPTVEGLQQVMTKLQGLPPMPGRLGKDIGLVVSGNTTRARDEVIGAIERLRRVANYEPVAAPEPVTVPRRGGRRRRVRKTPKSTGQSSLPSIAELKRRS